MGVAGDSSAHGVSTIATVAGLTLQYTLLQSNKGVNQFEYRPGRVRRHGGTVEHWFVWIGYNFTVEFVDGSKFGHVYPRAGDEGKDLSCGGLYSHHAAHLVLHEHLSVLLQLCIDGADDGFAGYGRFVVFAVGKAGLDLVVDIPQVYVVPFLTFEDMFVRLFDSGAAYVITHFVFGVAAQERSIGLGDVPEKVAAGIEGVGTQRAGYCTEPWKLPGFLVEQGVLACSDLFDKREGLVPDPAAVLFVFGQPGFDRWHIESKDMAKVKCVELLYLNGGDHDVVRGFVGHQHFAVPVQHKPPCRVLDIVTESVVACGYLVLLVNDLEIEQSYQKNQGNY